jgi:hypothetical protein
MGDRRIAESLFGLALVAQKTQQHEQSVALLAATAALLATLDACLETASQAGFDAAVATLRAELPEEKFVQAWAAGQAWTFEQVVANAWAMADESPAVD